MKKNNFTKLSAKYFAFLMLGSFIFAACSDDDEPVKAGDVTAIFTSSPEGTTVTFVNASVNATDWAWEFGDGNTSTDENPVHTYDMAGSYEVTLTASNVDPSTHSTTETVVTQNGGILASKIVDKEWIPAHGEVWSYAQGGSDADHGVTWDDQNPVDFGWGDMPGGWAILGERPALENDVYVFNVDGSYSVDFNGDFWKEYLLWGAFDEGHDLNAGPLPTNEGGTDMTPFATPEGWTFDIDEDNSSIITSGMGSHIMNPRLAYGGTGGEQILVPQTSVNYDIIRVVEVAGAADTLVLYASAGGVSHYITMHAYENNVDIPPLYERPVTPDQYTTSVAASDVGHTFLAEDGIGSSIFSMAGPYTLDYAATAGGESCTKFTRPIGDQWGNLLIRAGTAGGDPSEIDFAGNTKVSLDVYMPSSNDFTTEIDNIVRIRFIDESRLGGNFWQEYIQLDQSDIAVDTWVTLTFDFTTALSDAAALDPANIPDGVMIEFGEAGTPTTVESTLYVKDFKFIQP